MCPFVSITTWLYFLLILSIIYFRTVDSFNITVYVGQITKIPLIDLALDYGVWKDISFYNNDTRIVQIQKTFCEQENEVNDQCNGIQIKGQFLGRENVILRFIDIDKYENDTKEIQLNVRVIRKKRLIDRIFEISLIFLVSMIYINFGCALDKNVVMETIKKPIGPVIGIFCQYLIMPTLSFIIGYVMLKDQHDLRLGLFFTGISPAGGGSNVWTCLLNGNVNLSVTMTTLSTIAAFFMMPLWIFTLGKKIFSSANIVLPYVKITTYAVGLIVPLLIGLSLQKILPKISHFLVRILKCFSSILIVFIIIFAIVTNYHLFQLFSWRIIFVGLCLSWFGFLFGFIVAVVLRQPFKDTLAISIETGVQNTGISIFMLRKTLPEPESEMAIVIPCAVALMTPIPLLIIYIIQKIEGRLMNQKCYHMKSDMKTVNEVCVFDLNNRF